MGHSLKCDWFINLTISDNCDDEDGSGGGRDGGCGDGGGGGGGNGGGGGGGCNDQLIMVLFIMEITREQHVQQLNLCCS